MRPFSKLLTYVQKILIEKKDTTAYYPEHNHLFKISHKYYLLWQLLIPFTLSMQSNWTVLQRKMGKNVRF